MATNIIESPDQQTYFAQYGAVDNLDIIGLSGQRYSIKSLLLELSYYEDIYTFTISGYIKIEDSQGFIESLQLTGNEYIEINFGKIKKNWLNEEKMSNFIDLIRYLFYCNRYMNHMASLKFEHKLYASVKEKMEEISIGEFPQHLVNSLNNMVGSGELAVALDVMDDELTPTFKLYRKLMAAGNNMLISDDEDLIRRQADKMETSYESIKVDIPQQGMTDLYYVWDPNA